MKKAPEPRGTLKLLWNLIPDGTITDYTPTTISIDTHNRSNTKIRKSDLAIATETYQKLMWTATTTKTQTSTYNFRRM